MGLQEKMGRKKKRMAFRHSREGTSEAQRVGEGSGEHGACREETASSRDSTTPAGWESQQGEAEENKNNNSSVPTSQAPKSGIFAIPLEGWFLFSSSGRTIP